ncbi:MAG: glutathione-regulated potassium-efflux system protein KefC [Candidatus Competibacteraceae bacterium]|nr:glutathione-regulated potassium-efflux system protein KefC [Candidatus Competibacteraceae bacterium]MCB1810392.1 glutathione-regulated potassium-efflux system protein KefC [Candidatus Competibacteraceae bacterium]
MDQHNFLFIAMIYLLAAVVAVPISKRLGLGSVLGYLFAGAIIGPWGLQLISNVDDILHFSEFGVVLLLFLIGLELNPQRLWSLRKPILGMGGSQVMLTTLVLCAIGMLLGQTFATSLIAGMGLSLSSTAIALQTLTEKNLLNTPAGNAGFSVLLFQDIAVIPMLAVLPLLGMTPSTSDSNEWLAVAKVLAVIALIIAGGRYLLRPLFRIIAQTGSREIFTAFSLLLVIGIALLMDAVEMSMALGTFMAGVLLADSEYRHELEIDIEPFKGLLLGLFFISVGMSVDFGLLLNNPGLIIGLMLLLVITKLLLLGAIARLFEIRGSENILFASILAQGGEFAFVLFSAAVSVQALDSTVASTLIVAVALSMVTTPLLIILHERVIAPRFNRAKHRPIDTVDEQQPVIIAGFGRFGQIVARLLHAKHIKTTVLDHDPNQIDLVRRFDWKAYYGDITRPDLLHAAGIEQARLLILATDDTEANLQTARYVRERYPHVKILARVHNRQDVYKMMKLDVHVVVRETFEAALSMGEAALHQMGFGAYRAKRAAQRFRLHDLQTIEALFPYHQDEASLISKSKEARQDLERLLSAHDQDAKNYDESWG